MVRSGGVPTMSALPRIPGLVPPQWGAPLNQNDHATLAASWITPETADEAMLRRVDSIEGNEVVGQKNRPDCTGILIPYYWPGCLHPFNYRLRRDNPELKQGKDGKLKPERKYLGPPNSGNRLYIPPGVTLEQLNDVSIPIVLVEGEKKALALWRLANHNTDQPRFIPVAIAGAWNWRGRVGKTGGPKGERIDVKGPIADLNRIPWGGRTVFIVFDADVSTNESVNWARKELSRELTGRDAVLKLVNLPQEQGANGIDELLVAWGPNRVLDLFEAAVSGARLEIVIPPQFKSRAEGMFRIAIQGDRQSQTQLTNFQAAILKNIQKDDGIETTLEFEVDAEILGRRARFAIPASEFSKMNWPIEQLGAGAIIYPHQREYARAAIQCFSLTAEHQRIHTHTGWGKLDGRWVYLHAGGAIGADGEVSHVDIQLSGALSSYGLLIQPNPQALKQAIKACLRLVELVAASISFPLLAATFRAVFGDADFSLHLVGETGAFKSELAALHQRFFGPSMDRLHLPGNWSSTANALEMLAFYAKDALLVIDDFAPHGSANDVARIHAAADRVLRAAGNHAGRGRLDARSKLREPKPPRALILSTGEEIPRGQSLQARMLILEISKGDIDGKRLERCQDDACSGLYTHAMAGFLQWLASHDDRGNAAFNAKVSEYRSKLLVNTAHRRTPEIAASLQAAFELYVEYGVAVGAITIAEGARFTAACWQAVCQAAAAQAKHQGETEPTARYLDLLRSVLSSGRAHLEDRRGGMPNQSPEGCGWRRDHAGQWICLGDCIGWLHGDHLYIEPAAAFRAVQNAARDSGETFAVSDHTLRKRLREKGLLASIDTNRETFTIRRTVYGSSKEVLHFSRSTVLPESCEDEPEDIG